MKKLASILFIATLFLIGFTSCEKQQVLDTPGNIPGMGDTPGELQIQEEFKVPDGIVMNTEVQGNEEADIESIFSKNILKSTNGNHLRKGCGGSKHNNKFKLWIRVKITAQNTTGKKRCFTIPAGTVFQVSDPAYQNGITINPIQICIEANGFCNVDIWLVCLNHGKRGSNTNLTYKILGITSSQPIGNIINLLKKKKCNIEYYLANNPSNKLKSANSEGIDTYMDIADHIQNAIWQITNEGKNLTEEQIQYFESLPDVE